MLVVSAGGGTCGELSTGDVWAAHETLFHINYLEILAAFLTLQSFCGDKTNIHVRFMVDNTTAVAYINK